MVPVSIATMRLSALARRVLPQGWVDLIRQLALFGGAYWLYRLVRGLVDGRAADAFDNARELIGIERSLDLFFEPAVHHWASSQVWLQDAASWMYVNSHFAVTTLTLAYLYLRRNRSFYFVRNMFMVAMAIALALYLVFPTAPPRLMPEWGFSDPVAHFTGVTARDSAANVLYNPYAAVPSMHCCNAILIGWSLAQMCKWRPARIAWALYPLLMVWVVVATANHWTLDAVLGWATAAVSFYAARWMARARPHAWAFSPAKATA